MTFDELRDVCDTLGQLLDTKLMPGYIGNVWPAYYPVPDDRLWMVWFDDFPRGTLETYATNKPKVTLGSTEDVEALRWFAAFNKIAARYGVLKANVLLDERNRAQAEATLDRATGKEER